MREWLTRPHVAEWWGELPSLAELEAEYGPAIDHEVALSAYLVERAGIRIGFIQSYTPALLHDDGWWLDEHDTGVRGIDQFLADPDSLGQGLGTAMVRTFVAEQFRDPTVTRVQTDPEPTNGRAIRCYEKAGFRAAGVVETPDGPALLMYVER